MNEPPRISVIIPVHNGGAQLEACLAGVRSSTFGAYEVIVADDASTDATAATARRAGATVVTLGEQSGPAAARNRGASHARGEILLFFDADVVPTPETLARLASFFAEHPRVAAVFGSYDDAPAEPGLVSQYRNLLHHFHHQIGSVEAETFWTGCGAIRKVVFEEVGGFDATRFRIPSIEDIELGVRLRAHGHEIRLDRQLQVKHLKRWFFFSMMKTDIANRAIPWSRLIFEMGRVPNQLNLRWRERVSALVVALFIGCLSIGMAGVVEVAPFDMIGLIGPIVAAVTLVLAFLVLNRQLYGLFLKKGGLLFAVGAIFLHALYFFYSGVVFVGCWFIMRVWRRRN